MFKKLKLIPILILAVNYAYANNISGTTKATATLAASCIINANNINFGLFTPTNNGTTATTGTISLQCTKGSSYYIEATTGSSNSYIQRNMVGTKGDKLNYNVYASTFDQSQNMPWGTGSTYGTTTTHLFSGSGNGGQQTLTMYAVMNNSQYVTPDTYSDNITATIHF